MQSYIVLSLIAALCFSMTSIFNKLASKHGIKERWLLLFYYYITYFPYILIIPFLAPIKIPADWFPLVLQSVFFFLGNICFFTGIFKIDASSIAPFFQLQAVFVGILAWLFLGERFPMINYFWLVIILSGVVLVSLNERMSLKAFLQKAVWLIILMQFFHAISNFFAGLALKKIDFWNNGFWTTIISTILVCTVVLAKVKRHLKVNFSELKYLFIAAFFSFIGATSLYAAYQTNVTVSTILSLLTAPVVLVVSMILSRYKPEFLEHHPLKIYLIRAVGIAIVLLGVVKISVS